MKRSDIFPPRLANSSIFTAHGFLNDKRDWLASAIKACVYTAGPTRGTILRTKTVRTNSNVQVVHGRRLNKSIIFTANLSPFFNFYSFSLNHLNAHTKLLSTRTRVNNTIFPPDFRFKQ